MKQKPICAWMNEKADMKNNKKNVRVGPLPVSEGSRVGLLVPAHNQSEDRFPTLNHLTAEPSTSSQSQGDWKNNTQTWEDNIRPV